VRRGGHRSSAQQATMHAPDEPPRTRRRVAWAAVLVGLASVALLASGCSPGDEPSDDDFVELPATEPMTPAERVAAIGAITEALNTTLPAATTPWDERDLVAELREAAEVLVDLPEVVAVMYSEQDQSATIVMADGFPLQLINNRPPRPTTALHRAPVLPASIVPGSPKAVAVSYDGGQEIADEIQARLGAQGYEVLPLGASLADMRQFRDLGFLYIDTHASNFRRLELRKDSFGRVIGFRLQVDATGNPLPATYIMKTSSVVNADVLTAIEDEIDRGDVALAVWQGLASGWTAHVGITESFIQRHWSFEEGVVIMHSCYSGAAPFSDSQGCIGTCPTGTIVLDPGPLREAILSTGANVVMSFDKPTWPVQASPSLYYFIDRLLGANVESPTSPPGRPFDWKKVQVAMEAAGLMEFELGQSTVGIILEGSSDPVAMAPAIHGISITDDLNFPLGSLRLAGQFGPESGIVTLGGQSLALSSWETDEIVAAAPYGVAGDVVVSTLGEVKSNAAPLTRWTGEVSLLLELDDALVRRAQVQVAFRGDIRAVRDEVDGTPGHRVVTSYAASPSVMGAVTANGFHENAFGVETLYDGGDELVIYGKTVIDELVAGNRPTPEGSGVSEFAGLVELDPEKGEARLCMWLVGYHDIFEDGVIQPVGESFFDLRTYSFLTGASRGLLSCVHMPMNEDGSIPPGTSTQSSPGAFFEIEWKNFVVDSAPDADTPS
jgi:hypothetical protein